MLRSIVSVVVVSALFAAVGFGLIFWRAQDPALVETTAIGRSFDPAVLEMLRSQAASAVMGWWGLVVLAVAGSALLWLLLAGRRRPQTPAQARSGALSWWLLLAIALLAAAGAGATVYANDIVAAGWRMGALLAGVLAAPVAYWLATAFGVANEMAPSVPFATAIRG